MHHVDEEGQPASDILALTPPRPAESVRCIVCGGATVGRTQCTAVLPRALPCWALAPRLWLVIMGSLWSWPQ